MCLLIPAVSTPRHDVHRNQCSRQVNNLSKAASQYEMSHKQFPGYVNDFGTYIGTTDPSDPAGKGGTYHSGNRKLGSWVVSLLPSLDAQATYEICRSF